MHTVNKGQTLVIGAGGFMGRHIVRALNEAGIPVVGISPLQPNGVEFSRFYSGRTETTNLLLEAVRDCDSVIFLGGMSRPAVGMARISDELEQEANHVIDVAETCAAKGVQRFVFASSGGTVYGDLGNRLIAEEDKTNPINAYGLSKLVAELGLRFLSARRGITVTSLRLANPYGPGQRVKSGQGFMAAVCEAALLGKELNIWGNGNTVRDFVYVGDVATAFLKSLRIPHDRGFRTFNIGSGNGNSLLEICRKVEAIGGGKIKIKFEPERKVDVPSIQLSNARAQRDLEWSPRVNLDEGLKRTIEWWKGAS